MGGRASAADPRRPLSKWQESQEYQGSQESLMLWFYQREKELITVETRFDEATGEYLLVTQTADHQSQIERFKDLRAFEERLVSAEKKLAAERWTQVGPPI